MEISARAFAGLVQDKLLVCGIGFIKVEDLIDIIGITTEIQEELSPEGQLFILFDDEEGEDDDAV